MLQRSTCFLIFLIMTVACLDEPDCYNLNNDLIGLSFKKLTDSSTDTVSFSLVATDDEPPVLFLPDTAVSRMVLPLNYFRDDMTLFFETDTVVNVLRLGYTSQAQFVSENCGEKFVLSDLRVLEHSFDSVRLITDVPASDAGRIHIEIFQ
jgi:hypothetical protein